MANSNNVSTIRLGAMNVRGLSSSASKRRDVFNWLRGKNIDIALLSEVHSENDSVGRWIAEWGYKGFFSSFNSSSRGVCILFNNTFEFTIHQEYADKEGRYLILDLTLQGVRMSLVALYGPNADTPTFFENLFEKLLNIDNSTCIITGDWNVALDYKIDCKNYQAKNNPQAQNLVNDKLNSLGFLDIWRLRNPGKKSFTWFGPNRKMSRLDYFLISEDLIDNVTDAEIIPGYRTDHSLITLDLCLFKNTKGKGFWKFNNSLLHDKTYVNLVKQCIQETVDQYRTDSALNEFDPKTVPFSVSDSLFFDTLKLMIRGKTIPYCAKKKRERIQTELDLESSIRIAEEKYQNVQSTENFNKLQRAKDDLKVLREEAIEGLMVRSKAKWQREGEKCTKYFCSLEKRNYVEKTMSKLKLDEDGKFTTDTTVILKEQQKFYKELYRSRSCKILEEHSKLFFDDENPFINKFTEEESMDMEGVISKQECLKAVKSMKNNKSPGTDGFTAEFYKFFWVNLGDFLVRSYNDSFYEGKLSISRRQSIITCIPKPGKPRDVLKNWRPISLLNLDYKILSTILANRVKKHLKVIISDSQKGYVKGRYIGECTRTILDLINETDEKNIPGLLLLLDFEKAFDSIEWNFIERSLSFFGFGNDFIKWFNVLYNEASSCVINNGHFSSFFNVARGVRQGDPLSPYLFIIALECLSAAFKNDKEVNGIKINESEYLLEQYADDTTLFLDGSEGSLRRSLQILVLFEACSGLRSNWDKCEAIWIGSLAGRQETINVEKPLFWNSSGKFKALGITMSVLDRDVGQNNYEESLNKVEAVLNAWRWRGLTIIGRATVIKSLALPKLVHLFMILPNPTEDFIKRLEKIFFRFLWDRGKEKVKREILYLRNRDGGLKVPDIRYFSKALKFIWIKKLMDNRNASAWKIMFLDKVEKFGGNLIWNVNPGEMRKIARSLSNFWGDVLRAWSMLEFEEPNSAIEFLSQPIWYNPNINIHNRSTFIKELHLRGVTYVNDLFDGTGNIITLDMFKQRFGENFHFPIYHGITQAVPSNWKVAIRRHGTNLVQIQHQKHIISLQQLEKPTNFFYWAFLDSKTTPECKARIKWSEQLTIDENDWVTFYTSCFTLTKEAKLQAFQFKILHHILATNRVLFKMGISNTDRCCFCSFNRETTLHLLYECHIVKTYWLQLKEWLAKNFNLTMLINPEFIILGNSVGNRYVEHIKLFGKYYIYSCKLNNSHPSLPAFLPILEYKIKLDISAFGQPWPPNFCKKLPPHVV